MKLYENKKRSIFVVETNKNDGLTVSVETNNHGKENHLSLIEAKKLAKSLNDWIVAEENKIKNI